MTPKPLTQDELEAFFADPDVIESIRQGEEDIAAGRWYEMDDSGPRVRFIPNPDWPKDGPQPSLPAVVPKKRPVEIDSSRARWKA